MYLFEKKFPYIQGDEERLNETYIFTNIFKNNSKNNVGSL
jgi:hypothetical protein